MKDLVKKYAKFAGRHLENYGSLNDYNQLRSQPYTAELNFLADDVQFLNADNSITKTEFGVWVRVCEATGSQENDFDDKGADWDRLHISVPEDVEFYHFMFDLENEEEKQQFKNFLYEFYEWFVTV